MIEMFAATCGTFICMYALAVENMLVLSIGLLVTYLSYRNMK